MVIMDTNVYGRIQLITKSWTVQGILKNSHDPMMIAIMKEIDNAAIVVGYVYIVRRRGGAIRCVVNDHGRYPADLPQRPLGISPEKGKSSKSYLAAGLEMQ